MTTELLLTRPWRWKGLWRLTKIRHCGREDRNRWCPTDTQRLWRRWRLSCSIQRVETWHRRQKTGGCATFVLPPPSKRAAYPPTTTPNPRVGTKAATNLQMRWVTDGIAPNMACVIAARMGKTLRCSEGRGQKAQKAKVLLIMLSSLDLVTFTTDIGSRFGCRGADPSSISI